MNKTFARRFAALALAGCCVQGVQAQQQPVQPSAVTVRLAGGRISLTAKEVALDRVLKALEAQTRVHFDFHDPQAGQTPVSLDLRDQPLREGIRAILAGYSYCIAEPVGAGGLRVTVLASTSSDDFQDTDGEAPGSMADASPLVVDDVPFPVALDGDGAGGDFEASTPP